MSRYTIYQEDWIHLELEQLETQQLFLHCKIEGYSVSRAKFCLFLFNELVSVLGAYGVNKLFALSDNRKLDKFITFFGMKVHSVLNDSDVIFVYEVE